jgi:hypothetical protein
MVTDPCRPSVRATPSNDIDLVVKRGEVFPTRNRDGSMEEERLMEKNRPTDRYHL